MNAEKLYANRLLQMGVRGFVSKQSSVSELKLAISSLLKEKLPEPIALRKRCGTRVKQAG